MSLHLIRGDITKVKVDAIVNAANNALMGGGGVDGAIHRAGGHRILEECLEIRSAKGGCSTGDAVITTAGRLQAKYVIHAVGPMWQDGKHREEELLTHAYKNCLRVATHHHVKTIAFPNISTGVYNFPKEKAAAIAINTVKDFLQEHEEIGDVYFVCYDQENYRIYQRFIAAG